MYRFFKKYGKHVMAVFSAALMVAFALPTFRSFGGGNGNARVAGTVNGEKIYQPDIARARQAWQVLTHTPAGPEGRSIVDMWLPPAAIAQINRRPILFYLLQKEAQDMGASVSMDRLSEIVTNSPMFNTGNSDHDDELKVAMAQLLLVSNGASRAASPIKISEPLREHRLAELLQSIRVTAADFTAAQYATKVPPPTADQLKSQFEKYAGLIKGAAYGDNPFGFGYKYPDRVKIQYISVARWAVRDFVEHFSAPGKAKDDYEWEVEAQKYYRQHLDEFAIDPATPTTAPTTTAPTTAASLASRATTRPYADVKADIRKQLIDAAADRSLAQIQSHITDVLAKDWVAYHAAANGATRPTTVPASSLGPPYGSFEYLQKLAGEIQTAYGVLPTIKSIADTWLTVEDLSKLPGIGQSTIAGTARPLSMPAYIMNYCAPFVPVESRGESVVLQVMEPSRPLEDTAKTIYIVRVATAEPSHKPETLAEVQPQVQADYIAKASYDLAKADAAKLLDQARASGLKSAAAGKALLDIGPLTMQSTQTIPGLHVSPMEVEEFLAQAFKLLSTPTSRPSGKPVELIELPPDGRVLVAELADYQAMWDERSKSYGEAEISMMLKREFEQSFTNDWFNYDSVASRLKFVPDASTKDQDAPSGNSEPLQPIF